MTEAQRANRKLWIIFLIALLIALLPWIVLAQAPIQKQSLHFQKIATQTTIAKTNL